MCSFQPSAYIGLTWIGGISVGRGGCCVCVFGGGGLLGVRVVTEREFTVYGGNFWEGSKRSGAKRSEAKRSGA